MVFCSRLLVLGFGSFLFSSFIFSSFWSFSLGLSPFALSLSYVVLYSSSLVLLPSVPRSLSFALRPSFLPLVFLPRSFGPSPSLLPPSLFVPLPFVLRFSPLIFLPQSLVLRPESLAFRPRRLTLRPWSLALGPSRLASLPLVRLSSSLSLALIFSPFALRPSPSPLVLRLSLFSLSPSPLVLRLFTLRPSPCVRKFCCRRSAGGTIWRHPRH